MKLQIQSVIYGNQVDALVKAMKALQQAVKVYHRRVGDLQVRLIYGDSTPTPVLDEKTQKDIREMLKAEIEFEYKVFGFNSGTAKGHNLMAENTDADIMMIMNPDVILEPTCLCKLMEPLKLKEVGMVEDRLRWSMQRNIIQKQEKRNGHLLPVLCLKQRYTIK